MQYLVSKSKSGKTAGLNLAYAATVHEGALGTRMIESIFSNAAQQPGFKKVQAVPSK